MLSYVTSTTVLSCSQPVSCRRKGGPRQGRDMRSCVVIRQRRPRQELLRVVRVPSAENLKSWKVLIEGLDGCRNEMQGRSAYLEPTVDVVRLAKKRNAIGHALRCRVDPQVYERLEDLARVIEDGKVRDDMESELAMGKVDSGRDELWWD